MPAAFQQTIFTLQRCLIPSRDNGRGGAGQAENMAQAMAPEETPRYPKLTEEQKARVLAELLQEYQLANIRPKRVESIA